VKTWVVPKPLRLDRCTRPQRRATHCGLHLNSVLNQSYRELRGRSSRTTPRRTAPHGHSRRPLTMTRGYGSCRRVDDAVSACTRTGRARCGPGTGQYLKIVPHDDLLYRPCLEAQVQLLDEHPAAALTACRRRIIDDRGGVVVRLTRPGQPSPAGRRGTRRPRWRPDLARACTRAGTNLLGEPACALIRRTALPDPLFDPSAGVTPSTSSSTCDAFEGPAPR
jgi:hypothetical protein